jgi:hypothetical protein
MNGFLWESGHLGWGFFWLIVFSGLWLLVSDLVWRLVQVRFVRLALAMSLGWIIGAALIILGFYASAG